MSWRLLLVLFNRDPSCIRFYAHNWLQLRWLGNTSLAALAGPCRLEQTVLLLINRVPANNEFYEPN